MFMTTESDPDHGMKIWDVCEHTLTCCMCLAQVGWISWPQHHMKGFVHMTYLDDPRLIEMFPGARRPQGYREVELSGRQAAFVTNWRWSKECSPTWLVRDWGWRLAVLGTRVDTMRYLETKQDPEAIMEISSPLMEVMSSTCTNRTPPGNSSNTLPQFLPASPIALNFVK